ncbi:MAG TPA: hypothetical protein DCS93_00730 [Microscillaceae bacterium]|nr:hypothetical protein [Microscillaceae bacterium]
MIVIRTQKELAHYLGVVPEYIREIRNEKKRLSKKRQQLLKKFYEMKIKQLQEVIDEIDYNY